MVKPTNFLKLMGTLCLLLTACADTASNNSGKIIVVTPAIKGNSASLRIGEILEIQIPTIPLKDFVWEVQELDPAILIQEGEAVYIEDSSPNSAGGIVLLKFKAVGKGETTLNLAYVNASSTGGPQVSAQAFGISVEVK